MNRIKQLFQDKQEDILSIYFTAGYPSLHDTLPILAALEHHGVDLVEIGIPYSDPMADGPTIQRSGAKAIANGMTVQVLFDQLSEMRASISMPAILMGYLNQMMQFGMESFIDEAARAGIDGFIIPDLPTTIYQREYQQMFAERDLGVNFLVTPQTSEERIRIIDDLTSGFIYLVSDASITGARSEISDGQKAYFERIQRMNLRNPLVIGFGISNAQTYEQACRYSSGAIIGSAFINALEEQRLEHSIGEFVNTIR